MSRQYLTKSLEQTKQRTVHRAARPVPPSSFQGKFHPILQLQHTIGNRRIAQLIQAKRLRTWGEILGMRRKLPVGVAHDQYEQGADHIADQVLSTSDVIAANSMQRASVPEKDKDQKAQNNLLAASITPTVERQLGQEDEENKSIQSQSAGPMADSFEAGVDVETKISQSKGRGDPLPDSVRAYMEPRFGVNFSQVRVHTGSDAIQMNRQIGAEAFTHGSDIYFSAVKSPKDLSLVAHELTHVVQQTGSATTGEKSGWAPSADTASSRQPTSAACAAGGRKESGTDRTDPTFSRIQRRIIVNGKPYRPTAKYYRYLKKNFGSHMKEFIKSMHNTGKPPDFSFTSYEQMGWEVRVRDQAIKGMGSTAATASNCCSYPTDIHIGGHLDDTYWEKIGPYHFVVKSPMPKGKGPADAIKAIFEPGAGTELECNSMMVAVQYQSILKAIGDERFNARFPGGIGIVIERVLSRKAEDKTNTLKVQRVYKRVSVSDHQELLPGDWVYFKNVPDYNKKHVGFWAGLHAVYLGGGKFSGFGVYNSTNDQIMFRLLEEYNSGLKESEKKTIHDVIGIRKDLVRRPIVESYAP